MGRKRVLKTVVAEPKQVQAAEFEERAERPSVLKQLTLYRYRYLAGYIIFAVILLFMTIYKVWEMPAGLSESEMASVTNSTGLNFEALQSNAAAIVDAPYHVMQKVSMAVLGENLLAIRLPSVILAILAGVILERLLGRLFRRNIAIISAILAVSSVLFVTLARDGSPMMMNAFLTILLLYLAVRIFHKDRGGVFWEILLVLTLAMGLYSPLGVVPLAGVVIACLNKDVRVRIAQIPIWGMIILAAVLVVALIPLGLSLALNFGETVKAWLAWGSWGGFMENARAMAVLLVDAPAEGFVSIFAPAVIGLPLTLLMVVGLVRAVIDRRSPRSYLILAWFVVLIPVLMFNYRAVYLMLVPVVLLMTMGVTFLMDSWNGLFPINPYARIAGLVPIVVLVVGVVTLTVEGYFEVENYAPSVVRAYDQTAAAVLREAGRTTEGLVVVVSEEERAFYGALGRRAAVVTEPAAEYGTMLVTPGARAAVGERLSGVPARLVAGQGREAGVLVWVYGK
jgi:4-amino-4-deoxy-L-arabinose transferase-like glycosyltransferase